MITTDVPDVTVAAPPRPATAARAEHLVKVYGRGDAAVRALDDVTLEFAAHRFTAIMGPSGSGKSTLLYCLAGLEGVTSGRVLVGDTDLSTLGDGALTRLRRDRVGFIFQAYNLVPTLTAEENVLLPLDIAHRAVEPEWFAAVIDTLQLRSRLRHLPAEMSGGQQQRVAAARALMSKPDIIFADEPSGNLDSHAGAELLGFMRRSVTDLGQTIVMVTHDPYIAAYADSVVFLRDGRAVAGMEAPTAETVIERMKSLGS